MSGGDRPLMRAQQPAFEEGHHAMHAGEQVALWPRVPTQKGDAVPIAAVDQPLVSEPAVRVDKRSPFDRLLGERLQTVGGRIGHPTHPHAPETAPSDLFDGDCDEDLVARLPSAHAGFRSAPVGLVHFDAPREPVPSRTDHGASQLVQPGPCGHIAPQAEALLQLKSARAGFLAGDPPHRAKPLRQRLPRILKNRPRRHRGLATTSGTLEPSLPNGPALAMSAARAAKSLRPPETDQVLATRRLGREAPFEFREISGIILHGPKHYM